MATTDASGWRPVIRLVTAGQLDAGFASLATLVVQVFAVRVFDPARLGVFSLTFAAFVMASQVPAYGLLVPYEVLAVEAPVQDRFGILGRSLLPGTWVAAAAGLLVVVGVLPLARAADQSFLIVLLATAWAAAVVSPLQDHVRRTAHLAGRSWLAAGMSVLQLAVVIWVAVGSLLPAAWVPFGALVMANLASGVVGVASSRFWSATARRRSRSQLAAVGRWLLAESLVSAASSYASSLVLGGLGGPAVLGNVEGARVAGRPVQVAGQGLLAVVAPRSMEASRFGNRQAAFTWRRRFAWLLVVPGAAYAALIGLGEGVLRPLLPGSFRVAGLALATAVAFIGQGLSLPLQAELVGAGRQAALARTSTMAGVVQVGTSLSVALLGAFAAPASVIVTAATRWRLLERATRDRYDSSLPDPSLR